jgi:hypothetical protein
VVAACLVHAAAILSTDSSTVDWSLHARVAVAPIMIDVLWHGSAGVAWDARWLHAVRLRPLAANCCWGASYANAVENTRLADVCKHA